MLDLSVASYYLMRMTAISSPSTRSLVSLGTVQNAFPAGSLSRAAPLIHAEKHIMLSLFSCFPILSATSSLLSFPPSFSLVLASACDSWRCACALPPALILHPDKSSCCRAEEAFRLITEVRGVRSLARTGPPAAILCGCQYAVETSLFLLHAVWIGP